MRYLLVSLVIIIMIFTIAIISCQKAHKLPKPADLISLTPKQTLGKKLFFDKNLSTPPGQACADCHMPETAFVNPDKDLPVSRGVHRDRFGNRNDLTAAYASFSPDFHYDETAEMYIGGQFWDGRAANLVEQAKGPFLNPLEMANPDKQTVVKKIHNSEYAALFREVFGADALDDPEKAYDYTAEAIAEYESSTEVNKFISKYDYYLKGEAELTEQEKRGLLLFDDETKGVCFMCHPSSPGPDGTPPLFTDHTYDNLGVPKNPENPFYYLHKSLNPDGINFVDLGLGGVVKKPEENGKFKVPTLRNVALTSPYMHNGIFKTLQQVVVFYNTRDVGPWHPPEVKENINRDELGNLGLTQLEIDDIVAFLHTLTDGYIPDKNK